MENTFHIQWHITDFCNLRCKHCYQDNFTPEKDLSFLELKKIFKNIEDFLKKTDKKLVIDLTGGEVFLRKDWKKLVEILLNSEFVEKVGLITNGLLFNSEVIKFLESFPIEIKISAEGVEQKVYEYYRGMGNYKKFLDCLERIKKTKFRKKILMFTITESNHSQIEYLFDFCRSYSFDGFIIERFIPWGKGSEIRNDVIGLDSWFNLVKFLCNKCFLPFVPELLLPYRGFMVEIKENENSLYGAPCIVGKDGLAVMPDGTVFPCRRFPLPVGNLINEDLFSIWKNSFVLKIVRRKDKLKGICNKCKINDCYGCRAFAYSLTRDYLAEDPLCLLKYKRQ